MAEIIEVIDSSNDIKNIKTVYIGKEKYFTPEKWKKYGNDIYNFVPRNDDVFVMTLARSGTTLATEIVWLLLNNLDFYNALKFKLEERVPRLESLITVHNAPNLKLVIKNSSNPKIFESIAWNREKKIDQVLGKMSGPRVFKTHLPFGLYKNILKSGAKIIYIARNQKDRIVSYWRFHNAGEIPLWKCTFEEYWNAIKHTYPYESPIWSHLKEAWTQRNHPNVLFIFYEELRLDLIASIKKIAIFLGKNFSDEEIAKIADHVNIDKFRKNPMVNKLKSFPSIDSVFIGEGKIGGYKNVISSHLENEIDEWIKENQQNDYIPFPI